MPIANKKRSGKMMIGINITIKLIKVLANSYCRRPIILLYLQKMHFSMCEIKMGQCYWT